jgi:hypothetical protein
MLAGIVLALGALAPSCEGPPVEAIGQTTEALAPVPLSASLTVTSAWSGGYCASVRVTNQTSGAISGWTVTVQLNASGITTIWNAQAALTEGPMGQLTALSLASNALLDPGRSTDFGFCAAGATGAPVVRGATATAIDDVPDGLVAQLALTSDWAGGYCAEVTVTNGAASAASTWAVGVDLADSRTTNVWDARSSLQGSTLTLRPLAYNAVLAPGASTTLGFCAVKTGPNGRPSIVSPGRRCGTIAGLTCDAGQLCDFPIGSCQSSDAAGVCKVIPSVCTDIEDPVCGCDGQTYGNACEAAAASVSIDHAGACR